MEAAALLPKTVIITQHTHKKNMFTEDIGCSADHPILNMVAAHLCRSNLKVYIGDGGGG